MKIKRFLIILMILPILICAVGCSESSSNNQNPSGTIGTLSWKLDQTSGELVISGEGIIQESKYGNNVSNIKSVRIEYGVTEIANSAFASFPITSISIPNSVTEIGAEAFSQCHALKSIFIPESVWRIGDLAFSQCWELNNVVISSNVTSIGKGAFNECKNLMSISVNAQNAAYQSINSVLYTKDSKTLIKYPVGSKADQFTVPDGVTRIEDAAFKECQGLTHITIASSVTEIGAHAFEECGSLAKLQLGNGVTSIGVNAFKYCSSLVDVAIPESVITIGQDAFAGCNKLIQKENGLCYVGKWVVDADTAEMTGAWREDTVGIADYAFRDCNGLKAITVADGVKYIGSYAFSACQQLEDITIPNSVIAIGEGMISCSYGVQFVHFKGSRVEWDAIEKGDPGSDTVKVICAS